MEKRVTKRDNYNELLAIVTEMGREDLVTFINHELDLLNNKANRTVLTKVQKENLKLVEKLFNVLVEIAKPVTIAEIQENEEFAIYSNQKLSALFKKLVDCGRVVKVVEKGKTYFSVADAE